MKNLDKYLDNQEAEFQLKMDKDALESFATEERVESIKTAMARNSDALSDMLYPLSISNSADEQLQSNVFRSFTALYFALKDAEKNHYHDASIQAGMLPVLAEKCRSIDQVIDLHERHSTEVPQEYYPNVVSMESVNTWEEQNNNHDLLIELADVLDKLNPGIFQLAKNARSDVFIAIDQMPFLWFQKQDGLPLSDFTRAALVYHTAVCDLIEASAENPSDRIESQLPKRHFHPA